MDLDTVVSDLPGRKVGADSLRCHRHVEPRPGQRGGEPTDVAVQPSEEVRRHAVGEHEHAPGRGHHELRPCAASAGRRVARPAVAPNTAANTAATGGYPMVQSVSHTTSV